MKALRYFLKFQGSLAGEKSKFKGAAIARIKNWLSTLGGNTCIYRLSFGGWQTLSQAYVWEGRSASL